MARSLAKSWLLGQARPEYRVTIFTSGGESRGFPKLLRSFRDSKLKIGTVDPIPDLGMQEEFDSVTVWSADRDALVRLAAWFELHGHDTSGVW